jgi:hypothetical protein
MEWKMMMLHSFLARALGQHCCKPARREYEMTCTAARDGPAVPIWAGGPVFLKKMFNCWTSSTLKNYGGKPNNKYFSSFFHENLCNY